MYCTNCGKEMPDDAKFCPSCGHVVDESAPEDQEAEQPKAATPEQPAAPEATQPPPAVTPPVGPAYRPTVPDEEPPEPAPAVPEPPAAATPPPQPAGVPPTTEAPQKGGGKCWLIGCGILLLVGIIIAVVGAFMCARGARQIGEGVQNTLQNLPTTTNSLEIREPGESGSGGISDVIGEVGDLGDEVSAAASAVSIEDFNASEVDAAMLPTFYGFLYGLAEDDPDVMHQFMSPSFKREWSPSNWEQSPNIQHIGFRVGEQDRVSDSQIDFTIYEHARDTSDDTEGEIEWEITFSREGGKWYVNSFK